MSLDDKLRELKLKGKLYVETDSMERYLELSDEAIAQIKQAFSDEGYSNGQWKMAAALGLLTGQEWYDRFTKEYIILVETLKDKELAALLGAKRAAGIKEAI
jgi:hypothetical protein